MNHMLDGETAAEAELAQVKTGMCSPSPFGTAQKNERGNKEAGSALC